MRLRPRHLRQIVRPVERIRSNPRPRRRLAAHRNIPGKARFPTAVAMRQARQLLFDGPRFGGRDLADDALRRSLSIDQSATRSTFGSGSLRVTSFPKGTDGCAPRDRIGVFARCNNDRTRPMEYVVSLAMSRIDRPAS